MSGSTRTASRWPVMSVDEIGDHVSYWTPGGRSWNPGTADPALRPSTTVSSSGDTNTSHVSCDVIVMRSLLLNWPSCSVARSTEPVISANSLPFAANTYLAKGFVQ